MSWQQKLQIALVEDRWLQIGLLVLIATLINIVSSPAPQVNSNDWRGVLADAPAEIQRSYGQDHPLVIKLPVTRDIAFDVAIAQLQGRTILIKDETGRWRRWDPPRDEYGEVTDHSETLANMTELVCADDIPEDLVRALAALPEDHRSALCKAGDGE
ncbi:MAG: hypothetical protein AAGF33_03195 [Pseudomonadota bacterium]